MAQHIPEEYFEVSEKIIEYAKKNIDRQLNDIIYVTLTDHIYSACERYSKKIYLKHAMFWDIKRLYKQEFKVARMALEKINTTFNVELDEGEAAFIAQHFINAQLGDDVSDIEELTSLINSVMDIVKTRFMVSLDEEGLQYGRFITHLKFFGFRFLNGKCASDQRDVELFDILAKKYPDSLGCLDEIDQFLKRQYQKKLIDEEKLYLLIHIEKMVRESC